MTSIEHWSSPAFEDELREWVQEAAGPESIAAVAAVPPLGGRGWSIAQAAE